MAMIGVDKRFGWAILALLGCAVVEAAPTLDLDPRTAPPLTLVGASGTGFSANSAVAVSFDGASACEGTADTAGSFSCTFLVPKSAKPGAHSVVASDPAQLSASGGLLVRTDWAQLHFDSQQRSFNPYENVLNKTNVRNLTELWTTADVNIRGIAANPVVVGGTLYGGGKDARRGKNMVFALDAKSGEMKWTMKVGERVVASPVIADGRALVAIGNALLAIDADLGQPLWHYYVNGSITSAPTVFGDTVYVGSNDQRLYAFAWGDSAPTAPKWTFTTAGEIQSSPAVTTLEIDGRETTMAFIGSTDRHLYAVDAEGVMRWSYFAGAAIYTTPAIGNAMVYFGADRFVYAVDAISGQLKWFEPVDGRATLAVAGNTVYVTSTDRRLYAFDASTGEFKWLVNMREQLANGLHWTSAPMVANGVVYVFSGEGYLMAFNASDGSLLKSIETPRHNGLIYPVVVNGLLYLASGAAGMSAYYSPEADPEP